MAAPAAVPTDETVFIPENSLGRHVAEGIGRAMAGVVAFVMVFVVVYLRDGCFGWGIMRMLGAVQ